jgi:hypothetical protein
MKPDLWIEKLRTCPKSRRNLYNRAKRLMKRLAGKQEYPDVAVVRGLMELAKTKLPQKREVEK